MVSTEECFVNLRRWGTHRDSVVKDTMPRITLIEDSWVLDQQNLDLIVMVVCIYFASYQDSNKYVIFCVYRVATGLTPDLLLFIDKFTELLEIFQNKKAFFCCNTNINLLEIVNKTHFNTFYENITQSGYLPQITLRMRLGSNTLIVNIFTNNIQRSHTNCILQHKLSDHQAMICILKNRTPMKRGDRYI